MPSVSRPGPLSEYIDGDLEQVATGFQFTEGPIWMRDGSLHFSDIPANKRIRWHPTEGVSVVREDSNKCVGMCLDSAANLLVCEHVTSRVVREAPDGSTATLASHFEGKELNSPNDVIVARDDSVIFTDPPYGRIFPLFGLERKLELAFKGVYRVETLGSAPQLLVDDFDGPNGLCLSPDESILYVNDSERQHIRAFDVEDGFRLSGDRIFADMSNHGSDRPGGVDGMKVDERGNVYVTGPGGIWVFDEGGDKLGDIDVPEQVGNLNWGDDDWRTLYITASTSLYRIRLTVTGNRLGYMT